MAGTKKTSGAKKPAVPAKKKPAPNIAGPLPSVRVRMYRQGLGDCFLITFDLKGNEKHMLIDFGTLGTKSTPVTMSQVIESIAATTDPAEKKGQLEVLVATHAHKDHVSGFLSQNPTLQNFTINKVWMGWTEDPNDDLAKTLGNEAKALRAAIASAHAMPQMTAGLKSRLEGIAEFEGGEVVDGQLAMGDTIAQALDVVRKFKGAKTTYHSPGKPVIELPAIPGFRFYVLGPPRDAKKLKNMQDNASEELYGLARALNDHSVADFGKDQEVPFDLRFCYPLQNADQFFADYGRADQQYRRLDERWMQDAADLAAKLDDFRNNTSLAIAIERIGDRRVLLFPADAQEGNWLSWHDAGMEWAVTDPDGRMRTVNADDLLARTVFYKVGHHCSHNATARTKGLEIMRTNKELCAFIPVDRQVALKKSPPGSWRMPAVPLYRQLLEACDGRVVRADLGFAADAKNAQFPDVEEELAGLAKPTEWAQWKTNQTAATQINADPAAPYFEYILK